MKTLFDTLAHDGWTINKDKVKGPYTSTKFLGMLCTSERTKVLYGLLHRVFNALLGTNLDTTPNCSHTGGTT